MRIRFDNYCQMARLNIYIPDDLHELASAWRGSKNLSAICARALREELEASDSDRSAEWLVEKIRPRSQLENELIARYKLVDALAYDLAVRPEDPREALGGLAASYLERHVCDGSLLSIAGGRQMWSMLRHLSPRRTRVTFTAIGVAQHDPQVLHVHPNTLTTLLWLLYSPSSEAHLVGSGAFSSIWDLRKLPLRDVPSYFVFASGGRFSGESRFAQLIGPEAADSIVAKRAVGDFAYIFFDRAGRPCDVPLPQQHSLFAAEELQALASRPDARVVLVAGGEAKIPVMRWTLHWKLCNVLITDSASARSLLSGRK